jgi:hypothetical protein
MNDEPCCRSALDRQPRRCSIASMNGMTKRRSSAGSIGTMLMNGLALLLVFVCLNATAGQPPTGFKLIATEKTPKRSFIIEHYRCGAEYLSQIWLAEKSGSTNRTFLFQYSRGAEVMVSGDDKWLVVNTYEGSNIAAPILFRKVSRVQFKQAER